MAKIQVLIDDEWEDLETGRVSGRERAIVEGLLGAGRRLMVNGREITSPDQLTVNIMIEKVMVVERPKKKGKKKRDDYQDDYEYERDGGGDVTASEMERRVREAAGWQTIAGVDNDAIAEYAATKSRGLKHGYIPLAGHVPTEAEKAIRKHPDAVCERCPLREAVMVPSYGPDDPEYIFIGEAPGQEEVGNGRPFVGWSGRVLRAGLDQVGIDADRSWFTNAALCHPPDNDIKNNSEALACCLPRLATEIEAHGDAKYIVAVGKSGAESAMSLIGQPRSVTITRERGSWKRPTERARIKKDLFMTVHPAYVLRTPSLYNVFANDLRRATMGPTDNPLQHAPTVHVPHTVDELAVLLGKMEEGSWLSFDIETEQTTFFDRRDKPASRMLMIALCNRIDEAIVIPSDFYVEKQELFFDDVAWEQRCTWENPIVKHMLNVVFGKHQLVAHNGKFDSLFLLNKGYKPRVDFDTMLAHYALVETRGTHGLKQLATDMYGVDDYEEAFIKQFLRSQNDNYGKIPFRPFAQYAGWDVAITLQLRVDLEKELRRQDLYEWPFMNVLMKASKALTQVERNGILLDRAHMDRLKTDFEKEQAEYLSELRRLSGMPELNPNSHRQLAHVLFDVLGFASYEGKYLPPRSTNKRAFELIGGDIKTHPFSIMLFKYRRVTKMLSSYVMNILNVVGADDRVHCSYLIHGTITGRLSAREPALQTIPRGSDKYGSLIRSAFVVPQGKKLVMCDYSQSELRLWAADCGEPFMLNVFAEGRDFHSEAAIKLFGPDFTKEQRNFCKFFNFAYAYGGNDRSFAGHFQLPLAQATAFVHEYEKAMPTVRAWRQRVFRDAKRLGYCRTLTGRRLRFPLITPESLDELKKQAMNMPIQGMSSDLTLLSLCRLVDEGYKVIITVHDSIGIECDEADAEAVAAHVRQVMIETAEGWVPGVRWDAEVDILDRWTIRPDEDEVLVIDGEVVLAGVDDVEEEEDEQEEDEVEVGATEEEEVVV